MQHWALICVLTLAGCSQGNPETSRLGSGSHALAVYKDGQETVNGWPAIITLMQPRDPDPDAEFELWPRLDPGTRVLVMKDEDKGEDNPSRWVDVRVEDGQYEGRTGKVTRACLRPID